MTEPASLYLILFAILPIALLYLWWCLRSGKILFGPFVVIRREDDATAYWVHVAFLGFAVVMLSISAIDALRAGQLSALLGLG